MHIPEEFHEALDEQLSRIAEGLNGSVRWKGLRDDHYLKDLAITRLKMLPCGPLLVENGSGVPRRTLARNAVRHFGDVSRVLLDSAFRLRPCLEIHAHTPMLGHFHPEGWVRAYKAIARLLAADASSLGLVGGSWFFDPALRDISPRLAYLRDIPSGGGAVFLHDGATPGDVGNALAKSQTRRRLHEQGLYRPRSFIMFWSRGKLVEWARRTA